MQSTTQRAKQFLKEFGKVGFVTYISVGLLNWAAVYYTMVRGVDIK
jgi:hypothetical protein